METATEPLSPKTHKTKVAEGSDASRKLADYLSSQQRRKEEYWMRKYGKGVSWVLYHFVHSTNQESRWKPYSPTTPESRGGCPAWQGAVCTSACRPCPARLKVLQGASGHSLGPRRELCHPWMPATRPGLAVPCDKVGQLWCMRSRGTRETEQRRADAIV
ncbi:hypothetical protein HaLaN_12674 [Haematococcus lacustris]|uniref:Uncharacterized protein n=1 Tax=Haematococcus lacustris TaxID=44745 RepID=A0A699ZBM1_HAELA|nr:hypothetical protein HaLaN_12674 [Haematococcus lacustris]